MGRDDGRTTRVKPFPPGREMVHLLCLGAAETKRANERAGI